MWNASGSLSMMGAIDVLAHKGAAPSGVRVVTGAVMALVGQMAACADGFDNDGDGLVDYPQDPDCVSPSGLVEAPDSDSDGVQDSLDNCTDTTNSTQLDTDADFFGNACDCDFDNDGACSIDDFNLFLRDFMSPTDSAIETDTDDDGTIGIADFNIFSPDFQAQSDGGAVTDMDGDGSVGIQDFNLFLPGFQAGKPGPSGLREECGLAICDAGLECCNPVAGICVVPGLVCTL
jgi:hypothetical protein